MPAHRKAQDGVRVPPKAKTTGGGIITPNKALHRAIATVVRQRMCLERQIKEKRAHPPIKRAREEEDEDGAEAMSDDGCVSHASDEQGVRNLQLLSIRPNTMNMYLTKFFAYKMHCYKWGRKFDRIGSFAHFLTHKIAADPLSDVAKGYFSALQFAEKCGLFRMQPAPWLYAQDCHEMVRGAHKMAGQRMPQRPLGTLTRSQVRKWVDFLRSRGENEQEKAAMASMADITEVLYFAALRWHEVGLLKGQCLTMVDGRLMLTVPADKGAAKRATAQNGQQPQQQKEMIFQYAIKNRLDARYARYGEGYLFPEVQPAAAAARVQRHMRKLMTEHMPRQLGVSPIFKWNGPHTFRRSGDYAIVQQCLPDWDRIDRATCQSRAVLQEYILDLPTRLNRYQDFQKKAQHHEAQLAEVMERVKAELLRQGAEQERRTRQGNGRRAGRPMGN